MANNDSWTRWGRRPAPRPDFPAPAAAPSGPRIEAPTLESMLALQPLDHILSTPYLQRRSQPRAASLTATSSGRRITGTALRYNEPFPVGGFLEMVKPGAFAESLLKDDPRCIFGDTARILGRQGAGTLKLWESTTGLEFWDDVPGTSWAKDLLTSMDRGDIDGAGAAFFISQHHWEQQGPDRVRVVEKARLLFISVDAFASAGRAVADTEEKIAAASKIGFALAMNQLRTKKGQHVI